MRKVILVTIFTYIMTVLAGCGMIQRQSERIGVDKAKEIALNAAGVSVADASFVMAELDEDDGIWYYDIDFRVDGQEYEYDIDAFAGTIIFSQTPVTNEPAVNETTPQNENTEDGKAQATGPTGNTEGGNVETNPPTGNNEDGITEAQAKEIALAQVPGAVQSDIHRFEIDYDDGCLEYEGEIYYENMEYEFEIDGYSGAIRSWDAESRFD